MHHKAHSGSNASTDANDQRNRHNSTDYVCEFVGGNKWKRYRAKKIRSNHVGKAYNNLGEHDKYFAKLHQRMANCGRILPVDVWDTGHRTIGKGVRFCGLRTCPGCQSLRADFMFGTLVQLVEEYLKRHPNKVPLLVTLTAPNCEQDKLGEQVSWISEAWKRLRNRQDKVSDLFRDSFRSLEVTNNQPKRQFHPHMHVLVFVDKYYFSRSNLDYVNQGELAEAWSQSLGEGVKAIVDIRAIKATNRAELLGALREVSKYVTKEGTIEELEALPLDELCELIKGLTLGLRGKRAYAFTGELRKLKAELALEDGETVSMAKAAEDDETKPPPGARVIRQETFWAGAFSGDYRLAKVREPVNGRWETVYVAPDADWPKRE